MNENENRPSQDEMGYKENSGNEVESSQLNMLELHTMNEAIWDSVNGLEDVEGLMEKVTRDEESQDFASELSEINTNLRSLGEKWNKLFPKIEKQVNTARYEQSAQVYEPKSDEQPPAEEKKEE